MQPLRHLQEELDQVRVEVVAALAVDLLDRDLQRPVSLQEAEMLRHASAMHDVGKIGIPDTNLQFLGLWRLIPGLEAAAPPIPPTDPVQTRTASPRSTQ